MIWATVLVGVGVGVGVGVAVGVMDELKRSFNSSMTPAGSYLDEYYQML